MGIGTLARDIIDQLTGEKQRRESRLQARKTELRKRLQRLRDRLGLSEIDFSQKFNLDPENIRLIELGKIDACDVNRLSLLIRMIESDPERTANLIAHVRSRHDGACT